MPVVWLLLGGFVGWNLRGLLTPSIEVMGHLRSETERILDGVSKLHRTGALVNMDGLKLRHGNTLNNVELVVKPRKPSDETVFDYELYDDSGYGSYGS